jgi:hypothetical protein
MTDEALTTRAREVASVLWNEHPLFTIALENSKCLELFENAVAAFGRECREVAVGVRRSEQAEGLRLPVVDGNAMMQSIQGFEHDCLVRIAVEQGKPYPDADVITQLAQAVRCAREFQTLRDLRNSQAEQEKARADALQQQLRRLRGEVAMSESEGRELTKAQAERIMADLRKLPPCDNSECPIGCPDSHAAACYDVTDGTHCGNCGGTRFQIVGAQDGLRAERCVTCGEQELLA